MKTPEAEAGSCSEAKAIRTLEAKVLYRGKSEGTRIYRPHLQGSLKFKLQSASEELGPTKEDVDVSQ